MWAKTVQLEKNVKPKQPQHKMNLDTKKQDTNNTSVFSLLSLKLEFHFSKSSHNVLFRNTSAGILLEVGWKESSGAIEEASLKCYKLERGNSFH